MESILYRLVEFAHNYKEVKNQEAHIIYVGDIIFSKVIEECQRPIPISYITKTEVCIHIIEGTSLTIIHSPDFSPNINAIKVNGEYFEWECTKDNNNNTDNKCSCELYRLLRNGCTCGGI